MLSEVCLALPPAPVDDCVCSARACGRTLYTGSHHVAFLLGTRPHIAGLSALARMLTLLMLRLRRASLYSLRRLLSSLFSLGHRSCVIPCPSVV